ncbi:hypothetical protein BDY24DRAFT_417092, partial [Mrakia frigida]|uniref:uncharacterized protein n=1 Tax=Mrakia frigida TaxID=29902 RepID=UPI003FCC227B
MDEFNSLDPGDHSVQEAVASLDRLGFFSPQATGRPPLGPRAVESAFLSSDRIEKRNWEEEYKANDKLATNPPTEVLEERRNEILSNPSNSRSLTSHPAVKNRNRLCQTGFGELIKLAYYVSRDNRDATDLQIVGECVLHGGEKYHRNLQATALSDFIQNKNSDQTHCFDCDQSVGTGPEDDWETVSDQDRRLLGGGEGQSGSGLRMSVVLYCNLSIAQGITNGSQGRVVGLRLHSSDTDENTRWEGGAQVLTQPPQLPFTPGFAITDYKAQGVSTYQVIIDLAPPAVGTPSKATALDQF